VNTLRRVIDWIWHKDDREWEASKTELMRAIDRFEDRLLEMQVEIDKRLSGDV
jgi:predicted component of type VI protein secretion system